MASSGTIPQLQTIGAEPVNQNPLQIDYYNIKKAALILRALNHKLRQQILKIIDEKNKLIVTEIFIILRREQSVASQHLAILRRCGIVLTKREGKFVYYSINHAKIMSIEKFVLNLAR